MPAWNKKILVLFFITSSFLSCVENYPVKEMQWLATETEKKGLPLYLNLPNFKDIWKFKKKYPQLVCLKFKLKHVTKLGVPTKEYNKSLVDFDEKIVNLFNPNTDGIAFLVETYNGERKYWYYLRETEFFIKIMEEVKSKNPDKNLEVTYSHDPDWKFITEYPIELYKPEE